MEGDARGRELRDDDVDRGEDRVDHDDGEDDHAGHEHFFGTAGGGLVLVD